MSYLCKALSSFGPWKKVGVCRFSPYMDKLMNEKRKRLQRAMNETLFGPTIYADHLPSWGLSSVRPVVLHVIIHHSPMVEKNMEFGRYEVWLVLEGLRTLPVPKQF